MTRRLEPRDRRARDALARQLRPLDIVVRRCCADDLEPLEWFGLHTPHRALIREAFERQGRGEVLMLVAEANRFPVGQLWVDFERLLPEPVSFLWALRVLPCFRGMGIGTLLVRVAERVSARLGFAALEIGVEKDNPGARHLYERVGFGVHRELREAYEYTTPEGVTHRVPLDEWMLRKSLHPRLALEHDTAHTPRTSGGETAWHEWMV